MKFKKILLTLPVATMGVSLLATVLTSCNNSKIDDDKKITLNDDGDIAQGIGEGAKNIGFADAVKWALTRSSSWTTFKQALADEIVLKWYEDRMYEDKDGKKERNKTFKTNYDEWKYQINKDYDSLVQSQKTKYGTNYKFYLQNEYLSQYGGTEDTYKHAKLVEKAKSEFITNVWKFNYFSYVKDMPTDSEAAKKYPHIFTPSASTTVSRDELNKPENWSKVGFYASVNPSFSMKNWPKAITDIDPNFLAKNPDGDYATIQNFVFDKYFAAEKPFFSAASLFKYSKPHGIEEGDKLNVIYSTSNTSVKLPDEPNESFPFFGGAEPTDSTKGTRMYMEWFNAFNNGEFATAYGEGTDKKNSNGTVSITNSGNSKFSEDSQTLLLVSAVEMLGGTDPLYVPYATVAAQMYQNMMLGASAIDNSKMNYITQDYIKANLPISVFDAVKNNNPAIFKNFFFSPVQYDLFIKANGKLNSYLDLTRVYPDGLSGGDGSTEATAIEYHCPLFKNVKNYTYLYGDENATGTTQINGKYYSNKSGIIYVTNTMYLKDFKPTGKTDVYSQPWALQLNQSGMHAQTIDGYDYIVNPANYGATGTKSDLAKNVFKYRLMQKRTDQIDFMSGDLLGSSGKLKTYFSNNFADIILEMAQSTDAKINVFREISTMKDVTDPQESSLQYFFTKLCDEQKFNLTEIKAYLDAVTAYDKDKKKIDTIEKINNYIYDYRSKVITTAKSTSLMKTIYGNGLLAPLTYAYTTNTSETNHEYVECNIVADIVLKDGTAPSIETRAVKETLTKDLKAIEATDFYKNATTGIKVNEDKAFSPQVKAAKDAGSNRYWFKSTIVDKVMYAFYGSKTGIVNEIKYDTYSAYANKIIANDATLKDNYSNMRATFKDAVTSTYEKNKVLTGNTTYANIGTKNDKFNAFLDTISKRYSTNLQYQKVLNGEKTADDALAAQLFESTLAYLCINNFENLYKNLNSKIGENEVAVVAYINKLNPWFEDAEAIKKPITSATLADRYGFNPNVDNLFDQDGFAGGDVESTHTDSKAASTQYWNLIKNGDNALAGFTGIQSKTSNSFDSASGLQDAVFNKFAWSTQNTTSLKEGTTSAYKQNDGAWFAFTGTYESDGKKMISFDKITYTPTEGKAETFEAKQFQGDDTCSAEDKAITQPILRLAKKIANYDSIEDLKTLAKTLADAYDGGSIFKQIGYGEVTYQDANKMRIDMLSALPHFTLKADGSIDKLEAGKFADCFKRIERVEVHTSNKVSKDNLDYCFNDGKGNGYHAYITQVNKADITERRLNWVWENGVWVNKNNSPLSLDEFLFILCTTAAEASTQSLVVTQAIKTILGDAKLKVYDANLYNAFDSAWIKDWVKKPMGK